MSGLRVLPISVSIKAKVNKKCAVSVLFFNELCYLHTTTMAKPIYLKHPKAVSHPILGEG
jgi:hypothetical protein